MQPFRHYNTQVPRQTRRSTESPIKALPLEALLAIFLLTAPPPVTFIQEKFHDETNFRYPGTLGAVSKYWRDIVVSTPSLWTSLRWKEGMHIPLLVSLHVTRSRTLPIHLSLSFDNRSHLPTPTSLVDPSVDPILFPNMSRIATLLLSQPPNMWFDQLDKLSSTTAMAISWPSDSSRPDEEVPLNKCRSLRKLSLCRGEHAKFERVFYKIPRSLEELHLTAIPLDTVIKLLLMSPNLVELSTRYIGPPHQKLNDEISRWWFSQPFVLERLEGLTWDRSDDDWASRMFSKASTPKLQRLCLAGPGMHCIPIPPTEGENQFLERLPGCLSTLELDSTQVFSPSDSPLFNCHSIENLILRCVEVEYVADVFKGLIPTQTQKRFPNLKSLSVLNIGYPHRHTGEEISPGYLEPLVTMLEKRLAKGDTFYLTFSGCVVDWTPVIQGKLRNLRAKGVQLEIIEGSTLADWLE